MVLVGENGKKPSSDLTFLYGKYEKIDRDRYIYISKYSDKPILTHHIARQTLVTTCNDQKDQKG